MDQNPTSCLRLAYSQSLYPRSAVIIVHFCESSHLLSFKAESILQVASMFLLTQRWKRKNKMNRNWASETTWEVRPSPFALRAWIVFNLFSGEQVPNRSSSSGKHSLSGTWNRRPEEAKVTPYRSSNTGDAWRCANRVRFPAGLRSEGWNSKRLVTNFTVQREGTVASYDGDWIARYHTRSLIYFNRNRHIRICTSREAQSEHDIVSQGSWMHSSTRAVAALVISSGEGKLMPVWNFLH